MLRLLLFCFSILLISCSQKEPHDLKPTERHFFDAMVGHGKYAKTFDSKTQTGHAYSSFEAQMRAEVTFWDLELRDAYIAKMERVFRLQPSEEQALRLQEYQEDENYFVFIVSLTTRFLEHNDLNRSDSVFRILLESADGKTQLRPVRVEKISQKNQRLRFFYRNMSNFSKTYRVSFPKKTLADENLVKVHLTGPVGHVVFDFETSPQEPLARLGQ